MTKSNKSTVVEFVTVGTFDEVTFSGTETTADAYDMSAWPTAEELAAIEAARRAEYERAMAELATRFGYVAPPKPVAQPVTGNGGVCHLIRQMLLTDATYHQILTACYDKFPGCKTTAKSIASIARDMRAQGQPVAKR